MAEVRMSCQVLARDFRGRFLARYEEKKRRAIEETVKEGARLAYAMAPKRSTAMASSIKYTVGTSGGTWSVGTGHWVFQEEGTRPHLITGRVSFFWEREARRWVPGDNWISHPGNRAVHFMLHSAEIVFPRIMEILKTT